MYGIGSPAVVIARIDSDCASFPKINGEVGKVLYVDNEHRILTAQLHYRSPGYG